MSPKSESGTDICPKFRIHRLVSPSSCSLSTMSRKFLNWWSPFAFDSVLDALLRSHDDVDAYFTEPPESPPDCAPKPSEQETSNSPPSPCAYFSEAPQPRPDCMPTPPAQEPLDCPQWGPPPEPPQRVDGLVHEAAFSLATGVRPDQVGLSSRKRGEEHRRRKTKRGTQIGRAHV